VIGYGNQGRAWALNLRDSKVDVIVGTISDSSREAAVDDGFESYEIDDAVRDGDVVCLLIPDEIMDEVVRERVAPHLAGGDAICFASGYAVAFGQVEIPDGVDVVMAAPRMIGVGVRDAYVEGSGFIAFVGVERDATGQAWPTALALARGIGATKRGALEMTFAQEAAIDLFVEQGIAPALAKVWRDAAVVLLEAGIPIDAILAEFYLSGEIERTYQAMREVGSSRQWKLHSMTSQYGTMSRADRFADLETLERMRAVLEEIRSGAFAREWAEEGAAGYPRFKELQEAGGHEGLSDLEDQIRSQFEAPPP
jgi:ketol-acid reductoisomerase